MNDFLSYPVVTLFSHLFLGGIILFFCYNIGRLITPQTKNKYWDFSNSIFLGLISISTTAACLFTKFNTQLFPLLALIILLFRVKSKNKLSLKRGNLITISLIFLIAFCYFSIVTLHHNIDSILFFNKDYAFYSKVSYNLIHNKNESNLIFHLGSDSHKSLYHYIELWFNGSVSNLFNTNYHLTICFITYPLILTTLILYLIGFVKYLQLKHAFGVYIICIPFLTSLPPFISFFYDSEYLNFAYICKSMVHYIGMYPLVCFLLFSSTFFFRGKSNLAILIFSFTGLINPLFLGVIPLCLIVFWITQKLLRKQISHDNKEEKPNIITPLFISVLIICYSIFMVGVDLTFSGGNMVFPNRSLLVELSVLSSLILSTILYCPIYLLGFYLNYIFFQHTRLLIIFFFSLSFSCFIIFSYYYDIIAGDIIQLQYISWNIPIIIFGSIFLVQVISRLTKPKKHIILTLIIINACWGFYNTLGEKYSSLGGVFPWNVSGKSYRIDDIKRLSRITKSIGYNGGYIIDIKDTLARNISQSDIIELSCFNPQINTLRLNTTLNDDEDLGCKRIIQNTFYELHHLQDSENKDQILYMIAKNNIDWIFVNERRYLYPEFLRKEFKNKHEFHSFTIYSR